MRRSLPLAVLLAGAAFAAGCRPDVIVVDEYGQRIPGAKIVGTTLSMSVMSVTDKKGRADLPTCWVQPVAFGYTVSKQGYESTGLSGAGDKPIIVILRRESAKQKTPGQLDLMRKLDPNAKFEVVPFPPQGGSSVP